MDLEKIERLLDIVAKSGMAEVEVEEGEFRLVVRAVAPHSGAPTFMAIPQPMPMPMPAYGGGYPGGYPSLPPMPAQGAPAQAPAALPASAPPAPAEPAPSANEVVVQAPIVGTFYEAPAPDADPFVKVGDTVQPGDVLCIIEAMKLMNEIQSEHAGTIKQIIVQNAEPVEYDQPLFILEKA